MAEPVAGNTLAAGSTQTPSERASGLLRTTPVGAGLTGDDLAFMHGLLLQHPDAVRMIGTGVARITVAVNPRYPSQRMFVVHRLDGSCDDFSYRKCLSGEPGPLRQLHDALRGEISSQMAAVRRRALAQGQRFCPYTREPFSADEPGHVHHAFSPFYRIAADFIGLEGGPEQFPLQPDPGGGRRLDDRDQARRWAAHHARAARLKLVSKTANLSLLAADPDRPPLFCSVCGDPTHEGACAA